MQSATLSTIKKKVIENNWNSNKKPSKTNNMTAKEK
jgi:hypothetical protein